MKDIKKLLRRQAPQVLPDSSVKDNIKARLGIEDPGERRAAIAGGGTAAVGGRRNIILAICAALLAVAIILAVAIPLSARPGFPPADGGVAGDIGDKFDDITSSDAFYAYGAASVGAVLSSAESGGAESTVAAAYVASNRLSVTQEQLDTVNRYLALVESLLGDGAITSAPVEPEEGYQFGMTVGYSDLLGNSVGYTMYYNKDFVDGEYEDGESEENYSIEGVLIVEGVSYPVEGTYEVEEEEDESESELSFKAYTSADRRSYIAVTRESETEDDGRGSESEHEYVYTVCEDGRDTEKMKVSYESEGGELELEMEIERGDVRERLKFKDETEDGQRVIEVEGDIDGERVAFKIYVREGQYHYVFSDGSSSDHDRYDSDHDDDDDDDDDRRPRGAYTSFAGVYVWGNEQILC